MLDRWKSARFTEERICRSLFLLGLVLATCLVMALPYRFREPDEWAYYYAIENFSSGRLTISAELHVQQQAEARRTGGIITQYVELPNGRWALEKAPGYVFFMVPFTVVHASRLANIVLALGAAIATYLLLTRLVNERAGLIGSLLLLFSPASLIMLQRSFMAMFAGLSFLTIGGSLYILEMVLRRGRPRAPVLFLVGLLLSWAVVVRYTNLVVAALFALHFVVTRARVLYDTKDVRSIAREAVPLSLGAAISIVTLLLYNSYVFGSPLSYGYQFSHLPTEFAFQMIGKAGEAGGSAFWEILKGNARSHPQALLMGYPLLLAAVPAFIHLAFGLRSPGRAMPRDVVLLLLLWFLGVYALYSMYGSWNLDRAEQAIGFIAYARFYLPGLFPQAVAVAALLARTPRSIAYAALGTAVLVASVIFVQWI